MGMSISKSQLDKLIWRENKRIESMNRKKNYWGNRDLTPYNAARVGKVGEKEIYD